MPFFRVNCRPDAVAVGAKIDGMPRALVATAPRTPALVEYREPELGPGQVRLRSVLSVVKHGTELRAVRADTRDATAPFDRKLRLHVPGEPRNASRFHSATKEWLK